MQKWLYRSPKVKSGMALYQEYYITRNTIYVENFILVSESAYKAPFDAALLTNWQFY